jgi:hypothetical protein
MPNDIDFAIVTPAHAGIHAFAPRQGVDGRDKPGHDGA